MDTALVALIAGTGWSSGINLYLVTLAVGLAGRAGVVAVPDALVRTDVLIVAGVLVALEFVVDKVPYLDSVWDAIHTVVRPLGAAALGAVLSGDADSVVAAIGSGGLATVAHVAKATTRAAVNASPEPVTNIVVSLVEDGLVLGVVFLAVAAPVAALALVLVLVIGGGALTVLVMGRARRALRRARERRRQRSARGGVGAR